MTKEEEIEELRKLIASMGGKWQPVPNSPSQASASQIAEMQKQQYFFDQKIRQLEADYRKKMEMTALLAPPMLGDIWRPRPTVSQMSMEIHNSKCAIVAATIIGDLWAK